jgi:hypothetical protein
LSIRMTRFDAWFYYNPCFLKRNCMTASLE